ncbi:MAG TPA: phosphoribosyltransferase [Methanomicrobia archaeon]|nr:phosphoribosyltransferase [Methanomicrobia archaeon]
MAEAIVREDPRLRDKRFVFADRAHAGRLLAEQLRDYQGTEAYVLGIPAGGVPVAAVVSERLQLPLDVLVVRKIHIPWNREAGFGAISWDGTVRFNEPLLQHLQLTPDEIEQCVEDEKAELEKRVRLFRGQKPFPDLRDKTVIVVDDGLASGFTMLVALSSVRKQQPKELVVAVPTASLHAIHLVREAADEVVCLNIRTGRLFAVADAYTNWYDLDNADVVAILQASEQYRI